MTGWLGLALLRPAVAQSPPGNYTTGDLVFPRQPPPQYVAVDLGNGIIMDMNDNGAVLLTQFDPDTGYYDFGLWSGGSFTLLPSTDDFGCEYYWEFVANDGEVLGQYWNEPDDAPGILGAARWNATDGASALNIHYDLGDLVPDYVDGLGWMLDLNYNRNGDLYFGIVYSEFTLLAVDFFAEPVGYDDYYYRRIKWQADGGDPSQVGGTIFLAGDSSQETPATAITYPIATAPGGVTLNQVFANTTYYDYTTTELDYVSGQYVDEDDDVVDIYSAVYYNSTEVATGGGGTPLPTLQLNDVTVPWNDFFADNDSPDLTRIIAGLNYPLILNYDGWSLSGNYETLDYLDGDAFTEANLTANVDSETPLYVWQINSLGFGLSSDNTPWLNGADLQWSDTLPPDDLNMDGTANFSALLPTANLSANTYYELTRLAENSTTVGGWVYDEDSELLRSFLLVDGSVPGGGGDALIVDNNHNGNLSLDIDDQTSADDPFSWWLDDDPVGGGNATLRYNDPVVDGNIDLPNFFPVFLNIQDLLAELPPSDSVHYYLVQGDSAVNFVYTNLTLATAFSYQSGNLSSGFGPDFTQAAASATTEQVTSDGVELSGNFLANIVNYNEGVILVEGRTDSTAPLELMVTEGDDTVADIPLYLSLGPRILLLLHGMNSNVFTWNDLVHADFGNSTANVTDIVNEAISSTPTLTGNGVRCYRLQFGFYDPSSARIGLEGITANTSVGYVNGNSTSYLGNNTVRCGDFETFDDLGHEVDSAVALAVGSHTNAQVVLVGHSRGGLAARDFLETTGNSTNIASVVALLTTSTPHQGSPMGLIYNWLDCHPRDYSSGNYTSDDNSMDWNVVDFLRSPNAITVGNISFIAKPTLDVRRPVILDVGDDSDAITALNGNIGNLPTNILYGEIVYDKVDLGYLTKDHWWTAYSVFTGGWFVGPKMSTPAQNYLIGSSFFPSDYPGDGLVPYQSAYLTLMDGFPGLSICPLKDTTDDVLHAQATGRTNDLNTQLNALEPTWFPPPPP